MQQRINEFEVLIPSAYTSGQEIIERIMQDVSNAGFKERDLFGIRLSVDEAVTNAIKHGNNQCPEKNVRIKFRLNEKCLRIEVEDEGSGFQPESVPDPTLVENLEKSSGRGLMLMREFMTRIEYNAKGNMVVLEKTR